MFLTFPESWLMEIVISLQLQDCVFNPVVIKINRISPTNKLSSSLPIWGNLTFKSFNQKKKRQTFVLKG